ncbi:MAG: undecaprenyl-diphosphate phosphatase [Clostridia bacterium]|nr:undecaprenyl-diphosphate phosphatase [Clostridia bacterium]
MNFIEYIKAIFIGIIEGITEWLPVSSTGHMILFDEFLKLDVTEDFKEMFLVVIQLGAILAVPILFWNKLWPFTKEKSQTEKSRTLSLWLKVIVGVIPAAVMGVLLDDAIDAYLYNPIVVSVVVSISLIVYGVGFILVEYFNKNKVPRVDSVYDLTYLDALEIGVYQMLSLIPGTSRSGSTILGGMLSGISRRASAEFSFFMAIPIMLGASGLKILKFILGGFTATGGEIALLLVGITVSFLVSILAIKLLMDFVKRHTFSIFGVYRIVLGVIVLGYFFGKTIL